MRVHIFTLFPEIFQGPLQGSILGRAVSSGLLDVRLHNIRDYTHDRHRSADDAPYGGGARGNPSREGSPARPGRGRRARA